MVHKIFLSFFVAALLVNTAGCSTFTKKSSALRAENERLKEELDALKQQQDRQLEKALGDLSGELAEYKAKLEMTERGLVITFLAEIFFDSGKDVLKSQGKEALEKVAKVLNSDVPDSRVAIEGHTDTDPIRHSGWTSNWELSSARALAVLHYFVDDGKVAPERLSAVAYGEYHPVVSNATIEGKQKNRRVEIVILPSHIEKIRTEE